MNLKRLVWIGLSLVLLIVVVGLGAVYVILTRAADDAHQAALRRAPAGWRDSVRYYGTVPPDAAALAIARTADLNGAELLWDTVPPLHASGAAGAAIERMARGLNVSAGDTALGRDAAADTALSRVATMARARRWESLTLSLARADTATAHNILTLPLPHYSRVRDGARALLVRARLHLAAGRTAQARDDAATALSLGDWMARREPTILGFIVGRVIIHRSAVVLQAAATAEGDTVQATRCARLAAWSERRDLRWFGLATAVPDSALALANDAALALGWRAEAMSAAVLGSLARPAGVLFGPPRRLRAAVAALEGRGDADFARLIRINAATAQWLDDLGPRERLRLFGTVGWL